MVTIWALVSQVCFSLIEIENRGGLSKCRCGRLFFSNWTNVLLLFQGDSMLKTLPTPLLPRNVFTGERRFVLS